MNGQYKNMFMEDWIFCKKSFIDASFTKFLYIFASSQQKFPADDFS